MITVLLALLAVEQPVALDLDPSRTSSTSSAAAPCGAECSAARWREAWEVERRASILWKSAARARAIQAGALRAERDELAGQLERLRARVLAAPAPVCPAPELSPWTAGALGCAVCLGGAAAAIAIARPP